MAQARVSTTPVEEAGLALLPGGTRFADSATEAEYLLWQAEESIPLNRSGIIAGIAIGVVQAMVFAILAPSGLRPPSDRSASSSGRRR